MSTSLVAQAGGGAVPALAKFQDNGAIVAVGPSFQTTPYVAFASSKSDSFAKYMLTNRDLQDGDPVLVRPEPLLPLKLSPFRFYLLKAVQFWAQVDGSGQIVKTTSDKDATVGDRSWVEHIETLVLVVLPDALVPARVRFKSTKTNAIHTAIDARRLADNDEEWGNLSPDHKASLVAKDSWARFTCIVRMKPGVSKSSGFKYVAAYGAIQPTVNADWQQIVKAAMEPEFNRLLEATDSAFDSLLAEMLKKK